jgi:hypothetical protein
MLVLAFWLHLRLKLVYEQLVICVFSLFEDGAAYRREPFVARYFWRETENLVFVCQLPVKTVAESVAGLHRRLIETRLRLGPQTALRLLTALSLCFLPRRVFD